MLELTGECFEDVARLKTENLGTESEPDVAAAKAATVVAASAADRVLLPSVSIDGKTAAPHVCWLPGSHAVSQRIKALAAQLADPGPILEASIADDSPPHIQHSGD